MNRRRGEPTNDRDYWKALGLPYPDPQITFDRKRWNQETSRRPRPPKTSSLLAWGVAVAALVLALAGGSALLHGTFYRHKEHSTRTALRLGQPRPLTITGTGLTASVTGHVNAPPTLAQVDMVNAQTGFAIGKTASASELLLTTNGGRQWAPVSALSSTATQLAFQSAQSGYLLDGGCSAQGGPCQHGTLWATRNGGKSWTKVYAFNGAMAAIDVLSQGNIWAIPVRSPSSTSSPSGLLRSTDGGQTWGAVTTPVTMAGVANQAVSFISPSQGWLLVGEEMAAGSQGKLLYETTSAGASWTLVASHVFPGSSTGGKVGTLPLGGYVTSPAGLVFVSPSKGYMALARGSLQVTTDGGKIWGPAAQPDAGASQTAIGFWSAHGGYLYQHGWYFTTDGGLAWQRRYPPIVPLMIAAIPGTPRWIGVGDLLAGGITASVQTSSDQGKTWTPIARAPGGVSRLLVLSRNVWVDVGIGQMAITETGGQQWQAITPPSIAFSDTVTFSDPHNGWAYLPQKGLFQTTDGGKRWTLFKAPGAMPFRPSALVRVSNQLGYGLGTARSTRTPTTSPSGKGVPSVLPTTNLWVTHNGGQTWTAYRLPSARIFHLSFYQSTGIFWSGHRYWVTEDAAARWVRHRWPASWVVERVTALGQKTLLAVVGSVTNSTVGQYISVNGGDSWTAIP